MRKIKLILEYDGSAYAGWAPQPNVTTVHSSLAAAILHTTGEEPLLTVAGRTDAGVHARGQVVSFATACQIPVGRLAAALNTRLPRDIAAVDAAEMGADFHAQFSATGKTYSYAIWNHRLPAPLLRRYAYFESRPLDIDRMNSAATLLIGRHDFRAFRATGGAAKTTIRSLRHLAVYTEPWYPVAAFSGPVPRPVGRSDGRMLRIVAEGDGFLYNMVRILAGTLLEIGLGKRNLGDITAALHTGERARAGRTLPPNGLCLEWVSYD